MKRRSPRALRIADQLQRELSDLLRTEVRDPRVGMVTITAVEVSPDLSHAKVFVTHLAGKDHAAEAIDGLARTAGYLRTELGRRLKLFSIPALHFEYDDSIESGIRLSRIIDDALAEDRKLHSPK